jgi:hypothetical protein
MPPSQLQLQLQWRCDDEPLHRVKRGRQSQRVVL